MRRFVLSSFQSVIALFVSALMVSTAYPVRAQQPHVSGLRIVVLDGNGTFNRIGTKIRGPIVQVDDENNNPVPGVSVTFSLPREGPGGTFADGTPKLTVFTDGHGRAESGAILLNHTPGILRIPVNASLFSQSGSATVTQTNIAVDPARTTAAFVAQPRAPKAGGGKKTIAIIAVLAGAAAGAYFGLARKKTDAPGPAVTVGAPSVSAPR